MGYSGQPMVSVTNNRNLISKRNKLFDRKGIGMKAGRKSKLNKEKFDNISSYDSLQKEKRTSEMLSLHKAGEIKRNILALCLLSICLLSAYYILPNIKWLITS